MELEEIDEKLAELKTLHRQIECMLEELEYEM